MERCISYNSAPGRAIALGIEIEPVSQRVFGELCKIHLFKGLGFVVECVINYFVGFLRKGDGLWLL